MIEPGSHPFLGLLVNALHGCMLLNFEYSRLVIAHVVDALSAIYDT